MWWCFRPRWLPAVPASSSSSFLQLSLCLLLQLLLSWVKIHKFSEQSSIYLQILSLYLLVQLAILEQYWHISCQFSVISYLFLIVSSVTAIMLGKIKVRYRGDILNSFLIFNTVSQWVSLFWCWTVYNFSTFVQYFVLFFAVSATTGYSR